jgi:thymidylate synthase (FAD)
MSKITVTLLDVMGTDLSVVNAARVSLGKVSHEIDAADTKLVHYLSSHGHWSPFCHAAAQFRVQVPIFVERQIFKHTVGFSYNSISGRYVEFEPDFYEPSVLRQGSESIKQGSLPDAVAAHEAARGLFRQSCEAAFSAYRDLLLLGVCKEQARGVLPLTTMTEFIVSGSLYAWARMYNLRSKPDTQRETQEYARLAGASMRDCFPVAWAALTNMKD